MALQTHVVSTLEKWPTLTVSAPDTAMNVERVVQTRPGRMIKPSPPDIAGDRRDGLVRIRVVAPLRGVCGVPVGRQALSCSPGAAADTLVVLGRSRAAGSLMDDKEQRRRFCQPGDHDMVV